MDILTIDRAAVQAGNIKRHYSEEMKKLDLRVIEGAPSTVMSLCFVIAILGLVPVIYMGEGCRPTCQIVPIVSITIVMIMMVTLCVVIVLYYNADRQLRYFTVVIETKHNNRIASFDNNHVIVQYGNLKANCTAQSISVNYNNIINSLGFKTVVLVDWSNITRVNIIEAAEKLIKEPHFIEATSEVKIEMILASVLGIEL